MSSVRTSRAVSGTRRRRAAWWAALAGLLLVTAAGIGTVLGFVPVLSPLLGTAGPADLGVRYGSDQLSSAITKLDPDGDHVDITLTEAELSAYLTNLAPADLGLTDVQVRLKPGNRFVASGMTVHGGREYPALLEGRADLREGGGIEGRLDTLRLAGLRVPDSERVRVETDLRGDVERLLGGGEGFSVAVLETGDGTVRIVGRRG